MKEEVMSKKTLSRREFLRMSAFTTAGTVLAACGKTGETVETVTGAATQAPELATALATAPPKIAGSKVVLMYGSGEFTEAYRNAITEKYGIEIEFLEMDTGRYNAMEAAGTPPDLFLNGARGIGTTVIQKRVLELNPYVDASQVLKWDNFSGCIRQHMFDGITVGKGKLYGIPKDWSPDFTLWINTAAFEEAGVPVPSDETPMTWQEVFDMAPQFVKTEGDRTLRWGHDNHYWINGLPQPSFLLEMLPQLDDAPALYGESFEKISLVNNPAVMEIFRTALGLAQKKVIPTTLDPLGTWFGQGFTQGQTAILNTGYWFGGMAESDTTKGKVKSLPAPLYGNSSKRRDSSVWAQGISIHKKSQVPDAAWKVIEYFCGDADAPAQDRAKAGWGLPLLKSLMPLIPQDTEFNKQRYKVAIAELEYVTDPLKFNPFQPEFIDEVGAWSKALLGEMTLEEAIASIEGDTNTAITEQIDRMG
jgi:multiple sugar transport system substrate-binding protein